MSTMFVMEGVNLFCGDDPDSGKHLTLTELKLPSLEETFAEHKPGGSRVNVEFAVGIEKLELPFKLAGIDPQMLGLFGLGTANTQNFSAYGAVMDKRTGRTIEAKAFVNGRLGKVTADAFQRGELQGFEYSLQGIMHYELHFDGAEKYYWDFWTNALRVDGVDQKSDFNRILRIGG